MPTAGSGHGPCRYDPKFTFFRSSLLIRVPNFARHFFISLVISDDYFCCGFRKERIGIKERRPRTSITERLFCWMDFFFSFLFIVRGKKDGRRRGNYFLRTHTEVLRFLRYSNEGFAMWAAILAAVFMRLLRNNNNNNNLLQCTMSQKIEY